MGFPKMFRLKQTFEGPTIADVPRAVQDALAPLDLAARVRRGDTVAVTAGSRGIRNIAAITRAVVDHLQAVGGKPFIVPTMGSHGGGTAEGQATVLRHYGITEGTMGVPVRSSMEVVQVGEVQGIPVFLDRFASEADHIAVVARVKPHTDFSGEIESGLYKMMAIGLGKYRGAQAYHRAAIRMGYVPVFRAVGAEMLKKARILFGLGVVENGYDETARIAAFLPPDILDGEKGVLRDAKAWMARLPFPEVDLLILDEIGKDVSGSGMDTNIIGRGKLQWDPGSYRPEVLRIFVRDLTEATEGNACGIGFADFTTTRLVQRMDRKATVLNVLTGKRPDAGSIPIAYDTDREAVEAALSTVGAARPEEARILRVRNTLLLAEADASEAYWAEAKARPGIRVVSDPAPVAFDGAGNLLPF